MFQQICATFETQVHTFRNPLALAKRLKSAEASSHMITAAASTQRHTVGTSWPTNTDSSTVGTHTIAATASIHRHTWQKHRYTHIVSSSSTVDLHTVAAVVSTQQHAHGTHTAHTRHAHGTRTAHRHGQQQ